MSGWKHNSAAPECQLHVWTKSGVAPSDVCNIARRAIAATQHPSLVRLFRWLCGRRAVDDAVVGFAYTRNACSLFRLGRDGELRYCDGGQNRNWNAVDFEKAYEGRIFSPQFELRWLRDGGEIRVAVWAEENGAKLLERVLKELNMAEPRTVRASDNAYLLWGELVGPAGKGWTKLSSARIGPLFVPIDAGSVGARGRVQLKTREYFRCAEYGNWVFAGERLLGLQPMPGHHERQQ